MSKKVVNLMQKNLYFNFFNWFKDYQTRRVKLMISKKCCAYSEINVQLISFPLVPWIFMCIGKKKTLYNAFSQASFACICVTLSFPLSFSTTQNIQFKCRKRFFLSTHFSVRDREEEEKSEQQIQCGLLFVVPEMAIIQ